MVNNLEWDRIGKILIINAVKQVLGGRIEIVKWAENPYSGGFLELGWREVYADSPGGVFYPIPSLDTHYSCGTDYITNQQVASIPVITVGFVYDIRNDSRMLRVRMPSFSLPGWKGDVIVLGSEISPYFMDEHPEKYMTKTCTRLLEKLKEYMDAPEEIFAIPGEELPRVASTALLVNGREDQSYLTKWRHFLACQALQHYREEISWWHPTTETKARGRELALKYDQYTSLID